MKLGKAKKKNQFLESLKAEGELISEDTQLSGVKSRLSSVPPSDPVTVAIEEKINVTVTRDGGVHNSDIQGTLALQVLDDTNGFIQLQVIFYCLLDLLFMLNTYGHTDVYHSNGLIPVSCQVLRHYATFLICASSINKFINCWSLFFSS